MRASIDFSIFTKVGGAFGNVTGEMDFCVAPMIGDAVLIAVSRMAAEFPACLAGKIIRITDRAHTQLKSDPFIHLSMSDIEFDTERDALAASKYFEDGFGLYVDRYMQSDEQGMV